MIGRVSNFYISISFYMEWAQCHNKINRTCKGHGTRRENERQTEKEM